MNRRGMWFILAGLALAAPTVDVPHVPSPDVSIDGRMDESVWQQGALVEDFLRYQPNDDGVAAPGTTEVRMLQDDRMLYIGVRVRGSELPIRARVSARERINADDQIGIYLDPFQEGSSGYIFYLNAIGIQQDMRVLPGSFNPSWDTVFRSKGTVIGDDGYDLEIAFPFRSLRYASQDGEQDWSLMITRKIPGEGAKYAFPDIQRNVPRVFSQGATMTLDPPNAGSGLEIRPELAVIAQGHRNTPAEPMTWSGISEQTVRPGIDLAYGLTPTIRLGATLNPDFSQVENDETPIDVNRRFAFSFPERRPFFLDGAGFFADRSSTLYSRSIADPLYGVKSTGREGRVSVGVLHALDRSPVASVHQYGAPGFEQADIEGALASNSIGRVAVDVLDGGHLSVTMADKRILGSDGLRGMHDAMSAQLFTPIGDRWTFGTHTQHTLTGRPDESTLYGHQAGLSLSRSAAEGLGTEYWVSTSTPGLRRETGFLTESGNVESGARVSWTFEPEGILDTVTPRAVAMVEEEDEGDRFRMVELSTDIRFGGVYTAEVEAGASEFVEGGLVVPGRWVQLEMGGDTTSWLTWSANTQLARTIDWNTLGPAARWESSLEATLRPTAGIRLDTTMRYDRLVPRTGDPRIATSLRTRLTWQFTQEFGLRVIEQHLTATTQDPTLITSVLFTWLRNPGTALYLGYAETTALGGAPQAMDRTVFAKGTVLFRL